MRAHRSAAATVLLVSATTLLSAQPGIASDEDITVLRERLQTLEQRDSDRQLQLDDLQGELRGLREARRDEQSATGFSSGGDLWSSRPTAGTQVRLMDIGVNLLGAAGISSVRDEELEILQGHGHDPRQRGFTLQQLELSFLGAVDPYFRGEVHLIYFIDQEGESRFELEEAFATTSSLPFGLELEAGHFFTEFGRLNPQHAHQWQWLDAPVVNARIFGEDGMRAPGVRLGWLTPLPWYSELHMGLQNARGETMTSFLSSDEAVAERGGIGGRPFVERDTKALNDLVYLLRWVNGVDLSDTISTQLGASWLRGPNASGPDGRTHVYGADLVVKWQPLRSDRGWPFLLFEAETMFRDYHADGFRGDADAADGPEDGGSVIPRQTLRDWGLYAQLLWGFTRGWAVGLRGDYLSGSGRGFDLEAADFVSRGADPFRNDRYRISPLLVWQPSEYSRLRLQYNYDRADHLSEAAHSLWLGLDISLGGHPAHKY